MAYHVKPTAGNDSNDGLTEATAFKTIAKVISVLTTADNEVILYEDGDHVLTSNTSIPSSVQSKWRNASGQKPKITGAYNFNGNNTVNRFKGIEFAGGGASGVISGSNSGYYGFFEDCIIDGVNSTSAWVGGSANTFSFYNCDFKNHPGTNAALNQNAPSLFVNCTFDGSSSFTGVPTTAAYSLCSPTAGHEFLGCEFKNFPHYIYTSTAFTRQTNSWKFCTFDGRDARGSGNKSYFANYRSSTTTTPWDFRITNCLFYGFDSICSNTFTGTKGDDGFFCRNNWIDSSTNLSGYSSMGGDITSYSDPLFYNDGTTDYRLEPNSTASIGNNGLQDTIGAYELADPSTFFTDLPTNKVENAYNYKVRSRTNNRTGNAVGGGETDPDKVLSTSTVISGTITPAMVSAIHPNGTLSRAKIMADAPGASGTLPLADVRETQGGTLLNDSILTSAGGNYIAVIAANVRAGITFGLSVLGLVKIPAANEVKKDVEYDVSSTGTFDPITGQWVAVTADQMVEGETALQGGATITGTQVIPAREDTRLNEPVGLSTGLLDVEAEANLPLESNVKKDSGAYGPNLDKIPDYDPITGRWVAVTADQMVAGETALQDGNTVEGTQVVPAAADTRLNVPVGLTEGLLDVEAEANLPLESTVKEGSGAYGPNLDKIPALPLSKLPPSEGGSYVGQESNTEILAEDYRVSKPFISLGVSGVGELVPSSSSSVIDPKIVLYPEEYTDSEGPKVGQAGYVNEADSDIAQQLEAKIMELTKSTLTDYEEMRYVLDPLKNDFYRNAKQFGVRVDNSLDDPKFINKDVQSYYFRLVLTNDYIPHEDDRAARDSALELISKMEVMRRKIAKTRAGTYNSGNLIWELDWRVDAPDFYESDKLVILQAYFTLKAKNTYIP